MARSVSLWKIAAVLRRSNEYSDWRSAQSSVVVPKLPSNWFPNSRRLRRPRRRRRIRPPCPADAAGGGRVFNPDMSVIANFVALRQERHNAAPALNMTEVKSRCRRSSTRIRALIFFCRRSRRLSVGRRLHHLHVLPGNFNMKVGKMRAQFRQGQHATHARVALCRRPLVSQNSWAAKTASTMPGLGLEADPRRLAVH